MLSREDKRIAKETIDNLRKNPPRITQEHKDGARKLFEKHKANEAEKDRDIVRERKSIAKDLAGYAHNQTNFLVYGFGNGNKSKCSLCSIHETTMHYCKDCNWYCCEHRWFGNLTKEQQDNERSRYVSKQNV